MTTTLQPQLARIQAHAGRTAAVASGVTAGAVAAGLAELLRVYAGPRGASPLWALAAGGLAALAAAGIGWLRRPALTDVARAADGRLRLQSALVTAWQFREAGDPFTARTTARAAAALRDVRPADVYPWRLARPAGLCLALGITVAAVRLVGPAPPQSVVSVPGGALPSATGQAEGTGSAPGRAAANGARPAPAPTSAAPRVPPPTPAAQPRTATAGGPAPLDRDAGAAPGSALRHTAGGAPGAAAAPGGGQSGARGAGSGTEQPLTGGGAVPAPAAASQAVQALERVPMERRAYVRRYLLSTAETR